MASDRFQNPNSPPAPTSLRSQSGSNQKISRGRDSQSIDRLAHQIPEVARVEREQLGAPGGQRGDEHRLVFRSQRRQQIAGRERVRHPLDLLFKIPPSFARRCREFPRFLSLRSAIRGRNQTPSAFRGEFQHEPRKGMRRSTGGKDGAAVEENPHALPACRKKPSASRSSSAIQAWSLDFGMSRTGIASAGCRKTPLSRSSTSTMGFCAESNPSDRRISGGSVTIPRFETGMAVMPLRCNAAERVSSPASFIPKNPRARFPSQQPRFNHTKP
jgi:hypothetical protein